jgi:glycosyltransferase involved in cell wall biosynthesis
MKILYVATQDNPLDLNAGSGADYEYYHSFVRHGAEVQIIGPFVDRPSLTERAYRRAHRLFSKRRYAKHSMSFLHRIARTVNEAVVAQRPDVVFSISTAALAYCTASVPLVCRLDTTHKGHHEQYPLFSEVEWRRMVGWEKRTLRKVSLVITYSEWSADILNSFYRVPRAKIFVTPDPAALPEHVVPQSLDLQARAMEPLHLLLVGRNFHRKGVDIAIEVAELLNREGISTELRIVGLEGEERAHIRFMGLFNKTIDAQLAAYVAQYQWAHFLLHPARFEPGGIVMSEAAAFGLPAVTNAGGGLATTVKHGVSGIVLPAASPAQAYVAAIKLYLEDPAAYQALRRSTRQRYENELNWNVTGPRLFQALQEIVGAQRENPAPAPARQFP